MNIQQIRYVLEVAGSTSIRDASTRLYISQPALSASIRELEEELGLLIFERTNKGISLTDEGREFISYAKKVASQYEILEERYLSRDVKIKLTEMSSSKRDFLQFTQLGRLNRIKETKNSELVKIFSM